MTTEATGPSGRSDETQPEGWRRRLTSAVGSGLLAAAVFLAGLLTGALAVALLDPGPVVVEVPAAGGGGQAGSDLPEEDASASFVVSGACLGAVNAAQDTLLLTDDIGEAAGELDAARLDEIVRRLMPLQTRMETGLEACRVATEIDPGGAVVGEPADPTEPAAPTTEEAGD